MPSILPASACVTPSWRMRRKIRSVSRAFSSSCSGWGEPRSAKTFPRPCGHAMVALLAETSRLCCSSGPVNFAGFTFFPRRQIFVGDCPSIRSGPANSRFPRYAVAVAPAPVGMTNCLGPRSPILRLAPASPPATAAAHTAGSRRWRSTSASCGVSMRTRAVELDGLALPLARTFTCCPAAKFSTRFADAGDFENFFAGQIERVGILSGGELQRQNSHADQIRAVNALVAFGDDGAHSEQQRAFRRPVARGAGAVFFAGENHQRRTFGEIFLARRRRSTFRCWSGRWRVNPPSVATSLLRRRTLAKVPRTMTS